MTRDQIALALQQQQRQGGPGQPLGSPFVPAPVPQRTPMVAGTPNAPVAAPIPQHGFQTGYNTGYGAAYGKPDPAQGGGDTWAKKLKEMLFGAGTSGSGAP